MSEAHKMESTIAAVEIVASQDECGYVGGGYGPGPLPRIYPLGGGPYSWLVSSQVPATATVTAASPQDLGDWAPRSGELFGAYWERVTTSQRDDLEEAKRVYGPSIRAHFDGR